MNITIVVSDFPPRHIGGTEIQARKMAGHLSKKHSVTVFTRLHEGLPGEERGDGFNIKRFRYIGSPGLGFLSHVISLLNKIRKERKGIDILQCMMLTPNGFVGALARKIFGIPVISWVRGGDWYFAKKSFWGRRIISFAIKNSSIVLAQTEKTKREILEEFPNARIAVVQNGVDPTRSRANGKKIVFAGNLMKRKGVQYLLSAVHRAKRSEEILIMGEGPEREYLEKLSKGLNVQFTGRVVPEKITEHMKQGCVFVLPSIEGEGLPNVILEAMSLGLPVIATDVAGVSDVVKDGVTGFVVPPGDSESLAVALKRILDNQKLREKMSTNTLEEVKKYYWKNTMEKLENIYSLIHS